MCGKYRCQKQRSGTCDGGVTREREKRTRRSSIQSKLFQTCSTWKKKRPPSGSAGAPPASPVASPVASPAHIGTSVCLRGPSPVAVGLNGRPGRPESCARYEKTPSDGGDTRGLFVLSRRPPPLLHPQLVDMLIFFPRSLSRRAPGVNEYVCGRKGARGGRLFPQAPDLTKTPLHVVKSPNRTRYSV